MMRGVLGIFAGAIMWMVGFYALVIVLAALWPDFTLHARVWQRQGVFTFTPPMACYLLLFWALAEVGAGWVAMKIAWWYNLSVVIPCVPAVLLGGSLAGALPSANSSVEAG